MNIVSFEFLIFAAAALAVTWLLPLKFRWFGLLAASAVFVALDGWQSAVWLTALSLITGWAAWRWGRDGSAAPGCFWRCCWCWISA